MEGSSPVAGGSSRAPEIIGAGVGTTLALAALTVFAVAPELPGRLTRCLFKAGTGLPCPTCGTTRLLEALARGEPGVALAVNPLAFLALAGGGLYLLYAWLVLAGGLRPVRLGWLTPPMPMWLRLGLPAALVVNWIYLLARGV